MKKLFEILCKMASKIGKKLKCADRVLLNDALLDDVFRIVLICAMVGIVVFLLYVSTRQGF
jgi:hypothetical protein